MRVRKVHGHGTGHADEDDGGGQLPSVAVVVPTRNRRERLPRVVAALLEDPGCTEVVVVVDGSDDGSMQLLEGLAREDGRVRPVWKPTATGHMDARRLGAERASSDVVLHFDDDQIARPGLCSGHAAYHARRSGLVVSGYARIVTPERRSRGLAPVYVTARGYEKCCREFEREPEAVLRGLWMNNFSMARGDFLRLAAATESFGHGGQDERGFTGLKHADRDFGLRCLRAGLTGAFDRALAADHEYERTLPQFLSDAYRSGAGQALVHRIHGDLLGELPERFAEANLPAPARLLVRATRRPRAHRAVLSALGPAAAAAARARIFTAEDVLMRLMWRIEQQRGAHSL